jgi:membrane-associated phospholipid phosphatase
MMSVLFVALAWNTAQQPAAVYRISPKIDIPVTISASLVLVLPYAYADRLIKPRCPCDPREVNAFDRPAIGNKSPTAKTLSDVTVGAVLIVPLALDALDLGLSRPWLDDAVVFAQTLLVNGALVTAVKFIVQRPLPRTYAGDPSLIDRPEGYRSFYSGHTSFVFAGLSATAMTMRLRYGEKVWPWIVTAIVGSSVAIERVADGRHFPSDVIVGALIGSGIGIAVPALHARKNRMLAGWIVGPAPSGGLTIGWTGGF